jgi:hypothetical protein
MTSIDIPSSAAAATAGGCDTVGANNGIGLSGLIGILGSDLTSLTQPDENGDISLLLLAHLDGWEAGQTAEEAGDVSLRMYNGDPDGENYTIDLDSFNDGTPESGSRLSFEASLAGCGMTTATSDFNLSLPVAGIAISVQLSETRVVGNITPADNGFGLSNARITGYLTKTSIADLIRGVQALCASDDAPDFCATAGMILNGDPAILTDTVILPILRGADSLVTDNGVEGDCSAADCNAVSVCMIIEGTPATISGLSAD